MTSLHEAVPGSERWCGKPDVVMSPRCHHQSASARDISAEVPRLTQQTHYLTRQVCVCMCVYVDRERGGRERARERERWRESEREGEMTH